MCIALDFQGQKSEHFLKCNVEDSRMYKRTNHRRRGNWLKTCYYRNWPEENIHLRVNTCLLLVEFEVRTVRCRPIVFFVKICSKHQDTYLRLRTYKTSLMRCFVFLLCRIIACLLSEIYMYNPVIYNVIKYSIESWPSEALYQDLDSFQVSKRFLKSFYL